MKKTVTHVALGISLALSGSSAFAGTDECYGYKSTTDYFECGAHGNCVWWTAYMRPDIAEIIDSDGGGWGGGNWYSRLEDKGLLVGSVPEAGAVADFLSPGHDAFVTRAHSDGSFSVSEMDYDGDLGSGNGVQYATYHPHSGNRYTREDIDGNMGDPGGWTLNGFIYAEDPVVIPGNSFVMRRVEEYGWYPAYDSCANAESWYRYDDEGNLEDFRRYVGQDFCNDIYERYFPDKISYDALFGDAQACYQ